MIMVRRDATNEALKNLYKQLDAESDLRVELYYKRQGEVIRLDAEIELLDEILGMIKEVGRELSCPVEEW
ncbi:hypothetical protein [Faecalibaculum rodentium]|uniref:hypothetical protein n=1 Tax=Faecalibaculum rodentium TaxID=1702221 RepID=UPI0023F20EF4|nr:hypothetical protein [Faecalibaculum rodentium]